MQKFSYKARNKNGMLMQGEVQADTINAAKEKLAADGLIPITVAPISKLNSKFQIKLFSKIDPQEVILFTKQFGALFKAGMGMETIFNTLAAQAKNEDFKKILESIREDVQSGTSLTKAFSKHPDIFDKLYVSMLASGEEAGILDRVLDYLATLLEKDYTIRKGISSATLYPKIVIGVLVVGFIVVMAYVVPNFVMMFDAFKVELPLPTRIMIALSNFFEKYLLVVIIGLVASVVGFKKYSKTQKGRMQLDKIALRLPVFGELNNKVANARFANILASLYKSGLPVTKGLEITASTIGNEIVMKEIKIIQSDVEKGSSLADSMRKLTTFSPLLIEATNIGEKTGSLDDMLQSIAEHYDMEVDHMIKNLSTLIEPILLVVLFAGVGLFALAIFLPTFHLAAGVSGG